MLCAHALGSSKEHFVAAAEVLGQRFDCVALDQRGHGGTTVDGEDEFTAEEMARDLVAVMDHVGWSRATLAGTSLGAGTTLLVALRHPDRVNLLIQDLPGFGPGSNHDPGSVERVAGALERGLFEEAAREATRALPAIAALALRDSLLQQWRAFPADELGPKLAGAFRATTRWRIVDNWPQALEAVSAPTHILALRRDPMHPFAVADAMARAIPRARLWPRVPSFHPRDVARQWIELADASGT